MLTDLLHNVVQQSHDIANIEILIAYDEDDLPTVKLVPQLSAEFPWARFYGRSRGTNCSDQYFNWLWRYSLGRYLWALNDDVLIETKDWDLLAWQKIQAFAPAQTDDILFGYTSDRHPRGPAYYSEFPFLSRAATEVLGYLLPPFFPGYGADNYIHALFLAIDRIVDMGEIKVRHICPPDATAHTHPWSNVRNDSQAPQDIEKLRSSLRPARLPSNII